MSTGDGLGTRGGCIHGPGPCGECAARTGGDDAPVYRPDQLLGARHDGPDHTGEVVDCEPIAEETGQAASRERMLERIAGIRFLAEEAFTRLHGYRERAEAAESKLAGVVSYCEGYLSTDPCCPDAIKDILAIISGEEAA